MKIVFMGTPDFAVGTLEAIIEAGHEVLLVVTQPDKPKGRSGALQYTPVKECALAHGIEVFQPTKIRLEENVEVRNKLKYKFNEIMIDEYQDTSDLQDLFISFIENNNSLSSLFK